jgi:hypothetical protein
MKCNIGKTDQILRLLGGLIVIIAGIIFNSWWGLIGVVLIATALFRWCPLYIPLKISTLKKKE